MRRSDFDVKTLGTDSLGTGRKCYMYSVARVVDGSKNCMAYVTIRSLYVVAKWMLKYAILLHPRTGCQDECLCRTHGIGLRNGGNQ